MDLDAAAVDEQLRGHTFDTGQIGKDAFPYALVRPSPETVVERLLRSVDVLRAVTPSATALERVDYAGQHPTVIHPRHPPRISRQKWLDPRPLLI